MSISLFQASRIATSEAKTKETMDTLVDEFNKGVDGEPSTKKQLAIFILSCIESAGREVIIENNTSLFPLSGQELSSMFLIGVQTGIEYERAKNG